MINSVEEISKWMSSNRLKVNPTKLEFLWAATSRREHLIPREAIRLNRVDIAPSRSVKLLGVHIDDDLSLSTQISKTVSSGFFYLRQIRSIRRCLPTDTAKSLVNAFVISRLDYCSGLYAKIQQGQIDRLQSVLNGAARLIFGATRFSHVTPLLRDRFIGCGVENGSS